jgi:hypothetical protein
MAHHNLATLVDLHDRYSQLEARRSSLTQQREAIDETLKLIEDEQDELIEEVRGGVPEPAGNRWEPIAKTGDYPDGLFRIKRRTRRQANNKAYSELVDRFPRLLEIANSISVSIPAGTAMLALDGEPSSRTALGDFVADKIAQASKKVSKRGLEKALETGSLPDAGKLPAKILSKLADIFELEERVVVEPVALASAKASEEAGTSQRKGRS